MKYFGKGTRTRDIENPSEKKERLIKYFIKTVSNKYSVYFAAFIFCEFLNLAVVITHLYATESFLNQRYLTYGWDVLQFHILPAEEQRVGGVAALHSCSSSPAGSLAG